MVLLAAVLALVVIQIVLLLLSPQFRDTKPFDWYYYKVYRPVILDNTRYRYKFYLVPGFYLAVYLYMAHTFYAKALYFIEHRLYTVEKYIIIPILLILPLTFLVLSIAVKPETIENRRPDSADKYAYDHLIYYPNHECRTCKQEKPARSKHCSVCDTCILLADHHCVWINNCVGMGNYFYFFSFLVSNIVLLGYAFSRLLYIEFTKHEEERIEPLLILTILCGSFLMVLGIFCHYVFKMVKEGMTTNEKDKWFTIHEYMRNGDLLKDNNGRYYLAIENNEGVREIYSTDAYDSTVYTLSGYTTITSAAEIVNIYDKGNFVSNLKDFIE
ncbi:Palmitoyltransferase SWF1 [Nakaseomyces bracarensis]|uniref:Palmitoyltransferase n=1 Tax=Nakaseomyces bracarensis TaxID=273131 RepID=A0ABR4NWG5_9SACH